MIRIVAWPVFWLAVIAASSWLLYEVVDPWLARREYARSEAVASARRVARR